jgi:hypothetical protein
MLRYQDVGGAFTSSASRFENTFGMERSEMDMAVCSSTQHWHYQNSPGIAARLTLS